MDSGIILCVLSLLLIAIGIIGTFLPVLPGLIISVAGLFIYKFGVNPNFPNLYLWIFSICTIIASIFEYILPTYTTKKYGGTRWGRIGAILGMLLGFLSPIPFGFLIGMFAGVFVGEILHDRNNLQKAISSVKGSFIGFLYSTGFSFITALAILIVVMIDIAKNFSL